MPPSLSSRERAHLKARAHALEPVVHIGQGGLTSSVMAEIERSLDAHGLIKVRAAGAERDERKAMFEAICSHTDAARVQSVGKVIVLWRPQPEAPKAEPG
jgi:putative YhbY family RNA-binding protein